MRKFFKKNLVCRCITLTLVVTFVFTGIPVGVQANLGNADKLRTQSTLQATDGGRAEILDALHVDLYTRAKQVIASMPEGNVVKIYNYDRGKGGYVLTKADKKTLKKLLARDEVGLIEDEDNPGQYIWARKIDGAVVTKNGDLFISGRISYPTIADVPINRINLPRYTKIVPLAYYFFKTYLGKGEYAWISDIITNAKVLLVTSESLGERHFSVDKTTKTIKIEKNFMEHLLQAGQKRVGMGLFAEAAIALSDKEIEPERAKEIVNKIAQISLTGKNRLEDAIYLYNLKKEIFEKSRTEEARKLTSEERQYFLIDMMERNRGFNGRRAAKILRENFGYYGEVTPEEAEEDLRAIAQAHADEIVIVPYKEKEEDKAARYVDRTDTFLLKGRHLADLNLIKDRRIVWDFEIDSRDAPIFGGKVAYTGMMQWAPYLITLPMFATAGVCFRTDLIAYNRYKEEFEAYDKELKDGLKDLEKTYGKDSKSEEYLDKRRRLVEYIANKFQKKLDWGVAGVSPELVKEIKEALKLLAERTGVSVFQLILAVRSSAIGEDSEAVSFAGRQDTTLFVSNLKEEFERIGLKPEDYGYSWLDLYRSVFPWYDILNKARAKLGDKIVTDQMYDTFIREWLVNQRSLFNKRSIDYRLEIDFPVFTDDVAMSTIFQEQANTEFGYVAFGVNRTSGYPEIQIEIIEGQTNPLVEGSGTGDLVFVGYYGEDPYRFTKVPDSRQELHVPNIFGKEMIIKGETSKGGVFRLKFPKELEGMPAITDTELLTQIGEADAELTRFFGMYSDIEGGLIVRRDRRGNVMYVEDSSEPDGIAKDNLGNPRMLMVKFQIQIRPETTWNFKNPDVIEQHWLELPDEEYRRAVQEGKVLYSTAQAHTQGAAKGEVFIVEKEHLETWSKVVKKIMVTVQSDPDMNEAMRNALAVVAAVGGRNSHTMIVATEYGLIAISGIGDINKFYNGQKVTVDATRGVILEGDDYKLTPAGNDYNVRELGITPWDFSFGLNINSTQLAHKAQPFANKPDFYGSGLMRLELFLERIGAAGEGFLRYDNYKMYTLLGTLDKGRLSSSDRKLLNRMLELKSDIEHLKPHLNEDNTITVTIYGKERVYKSGLEFYKVHIEDPKYPRYNPENPTERIIIEKMEKLLKGAFILGEQRYIEVLSGGIKSVVEALVVHPQELLILAQRIKNPEIRRQALDIVDEYEKTYLEIKGALPTDEIIEKLKDLIESYKDVISSQEKKLIKLMVRQLSKAFYIRLDDRKSDEYENVLGSMVKRDRNPMLGYRGIRIMLDNPKINRLQLKAIRKVVDIGTRRDPNGNPIGKGKYRVRVFTPMVYDAEHVRQMNKLYDEAGLTADRVQRGIMTETPQAIELLPFLEADIDFTSNGWNDMLQLLEELDRQNAAEYFNSITERIIQSIRALASIANITKEWNQKKRILEGLDPVTNGNCGNWPAVDPVGAITLYLLGYDSASITLPSMDRAINDLYRLLDHLYGHDELGLLNEPEDRETVVKDLYKLIEDTNKQKGLPQHLINMLPFLKVVLDNRHFNIYTQIDPNAQPEIKTVYTKGSVSTLHLRLPIHYRLLEEYDKGQGGDLIVKEAPEHLQEKIKKLTSEKKEYETRFAQIKEMASKGEDVGKELSYFAGKMKECDDGIKDANYKLKSMELKQMIEVILKRNGYNINQPGVGKRFYIDNLKRLWIKYAKEAKQKGELFIVETAKEPADFVKTKLGGERYELPKEPNPDIGNRGMKKLLNPDRNIFKWGLQAIKELKEEGLDNIALALSKVREISEVDDTLSILKEAGLSDIQLGLVVNSPNIIYAYDYYLAKERGISLLLLDREARRELAEAKRGTEWDNINANLINDNDVNKNLKDVTIPVTKTAAAKYGITLYLTEKSTNSYIDIYKFNKIAQADTAIYNISPANFDNFVNSLKDVNIVFAIGANAVLENAGIKTLLRKIKDAPQAGIKIAVWANNEATVEKLKLMGVKELVDIITSEGLSGALDELSNLGINKERITLIKSPKDSKNIEKEIEAGKLLQADIATLKTINLQTPNAREGLINDMSLISARAITGHLRIYDDYIVNKYEKLSNSYVESGQISEEDLQRFNDLTSQVSDAPLVKVTEEKTQEAAKWQITYEETVGEI